MVYIFTECGTSFGYGHIVRCIAIYDELVSRGVDTQLVVNSDAEIKAVLKDRKYVIDNWYQRIDAYANKENNVIIDSYHADVPAYELASRLSQKALFIDDTNRIEYPKGIIVNPAIYADQIPYKMIDGQTYLLGANYTILRHEFCGLEGKERHLKEKITEILVIMGGSDISNLTPAITKFLSYEEYKNINKHVVLGSGFFNIDEIKTLCQTSDFTLYYDLDAMDLKDLMMKCDIAITAAGQTVNELIAMRLPFICHKVIDNQDNNIKGLLHNNIIKHYFDIERKENSLSDWLKSQLSSLQNFDVRKQQFDAMESLNLGKGVSRIVDKLICEEPKIRIRKIKGTDDELKKIMAWRMSPAVTKYMYTDPILTLDGQRKWFEKKKKDKTCKYWMICLNKSEIGIIAITNLDSIKCDLAWYIGEEKYRGKGIGKKLLLNLFDYIFDQLNIKEIYSEALTTNSAAIKVYKDCGFQTIEINRDYIKKNDTVYDVEIMKLNKIEWISIKNHHMYDKIPFEE